RDDGDDRQLVIGFDAVRLVTRDVHAHLRFEGVLVAVEVERPVPRDDVEDLLAIFEATFRARAPADPEDALLELLAAVGAVERGPDLDISLAPRLDLVRVDD